MKFLAFILGWILLSVGLSSLFGSYSVSRNKDAHTAEIAVPAVLGTWITAAGGALMYWVFAS